MKVRAGVRDQWVVLEEVESGLNRIVEVLRVADFRIVLRLGLVVPDAAKMSHHFARCNRLRFFGKCRAVFLDGSIEVEFAFLRQLHCADCSQGLRD